MRTWETKFRTGARMAWLFGAAVVTSAGCGALDSLVSVEAPSRILADSLETPANASRLLDGAVGDFECALTGYVVFMGTFTDELQFAFGSASWQSTDSRTLAESGFSAPQATATCSSPADGEVPGQYKSLSTARYQADHLLVLLDQWGSQVENPEPIRATAAAYSGYSHLLLGESMCSAAFDLGPELEMDGIIARAIDRFDLALAGTGTEEAIRNLALVGRARAHLDLGDFAAAKADAEQVTAGFQLDAESSTSQPRRQNQVFVRHLQTERVVIEGPFRNLNDPRVPATNSGRVSGIGIPIWLTTKYPAASSPIRLASWVEARLIVAEAELEAGDLTAAVAAINQVRTRPGVGLPSFNGTTEAQVRAQLLAERKAEFFLESQRQADIRRLNLPLDPPAGTPYPSGGAYGNQRCIPLPLVERLNNPNLAVGR